MRARFDARRRAAAGAVPAVPVGGASKSLDIIAVLGCYRLNTASTSVRDFMKLKVRDLTLALVLAAGGAQAQTTCRTNEISGTTRCYDGAGRLVSEGRPNISGGTTFRDPSSGSEQGRGQIGIGGNPEIRRPDGTTVRGRTSPVTGATTFTDPTTGERSRCKTSEITGATKCSPR